MEDWRFGIFPTTSIDDSFLRITEKLGNDVIHGQYYLCDVILPDTGEIIIEGAKVFHEKGRYLRRSSNYVLFDRNKGLRTKWNLLTVSSIVDFEHELKEMKLNLPTTPNMLDESRPEVVLFRGFLKEFPSSKVTPIGKICVAFSGQGIQKIGMLNHFINDEHCKSLLSVASKEMGLNLELISKNGPLSLLNRTDIAQVLTFIGSLIYLDFLKEKQTELFLDESSLVYCGLSLGEYTALVASKCVTEEIGLKLVIKRAQLMNDCVQQSTPSCMIAILGKTRSEVDVFVRNVKIQEGEVLQIANLLGEKETTVSGTIDAIQRLKSQLTQKKISFKDIQVAAGFHSPVMKASETLLNEIIEKTDFQPISCSLYQNIDGECSRDNKVIQEKLKAHMCNQVEWYRTIENCLKGGCRTFVECGIGNVLFNCYRRNIPNFSIKEEEIICFATDGCMKKF